MTASGWDDRPFAWLLSFSRQLAERVPARFPVLGRLLRRTETLMIQATLGRVMTGVLNTREVRDAMEALTLRWSEVRTELGDRRNQFVGQFPVEFRAVLRSLGIAVVTVIGALIGIFGVGGDSVLGMITTPRSPSYVRPTTSSAPPTARSSSKSSTSC